jgi:centromeric protein E
LREDAAKEVYVRGLSEVPTHSVSQAFALIRRALRSRSVRQTEMNERSSRSHAVLQLLLERVSGDASDTDDGGDGDGDGDGGGGGGRGGHATRAKLSLVDLAGSERIQSVEAAALETCGACQIWHGMAAQMANQRRLWSP